MKTIKTENAVGCVLCHDLTQIIPGKYKGARFRKGHVVAEEDIPVLLSMGKQSLYVYEITPGFLHEDDAAERMAALCQGDNMSRSAPSEGKIELRSEIDGCFLVDAEKLEAINSQDELMIASRHGNTLVRKGDKLCGTRVIPLVIDEKKIIKAEQITGNKPVFQVAPFKLKTAALVVTGSEVKNGLIEDRFSGVLTEKLSEYGIQILSVVKPGDQAEDIVTAIQNVRKLKPDLICCTGGMSVDPDDNTPKAITLSGAKIVSYGAPVLPGAMCLVGYFGDKTPILGLPGCVMYAKATIFDLLMPRIAAGILLSKKDICVLGEGGLCLGCHNCTYPNCGFGK